MCPYGDPESRIFAIPKMYSYEVHVVSITVYIKDLKFLRVYMKA